MLFISFMLKNVDKTCQVVSRRSLTQKPRISDQNVRFTNK